MEQSVAVTNTPMRAPRPIPKTQDILEYATTQPGLSVREIARLTDCDHSNVVRTLQRYGISQTEAQSYGERRAEILQGIQDRLLSTITDTDIQKSSLLQRVTATGILYDKERLERGLSTANIDTHVLLREGEEIGDRIAQLEQEIAALTGAQK
jgi:DNA-binding IclR family transcriptional regulator